MLNKLFSSEFAIRLFQKLSGTIVLKKIPIGISTDIDLRYRLKNFNAEVIFDVGANIGQSAIKFRRNFPNAKIYCFEPVKYTFEILQKNTKPLNVLCFNKALGNENNQKEIRVDANSKASVSNSIVHRNSEKVNNYNLEIISIAKLDTFVGEHNIKHISFLKIDTEGFDLEVLKGSERMLENHSIDFVESEVSMNVTNDFHVSFFEVSEFLQQKNYLIFGIYEQIHDFKINKPFLRRVNALFISASAAEKYKIQ